MHSFGQLLVLGTTFLSTVVSAVPVDPSRDDVLLKWVLDETAVTDCDASGAQIPLDKTDPQLPPPSAGLQVKHVVIGRGTQNYTCSAGNKGATPESAGAVATLYDGSCLASKDLNVLHNIAAHVERVDKDGLSNLADLVHLTTRINLVQGFHYFDETETPFFDLRQDGSEDWLATSGKEQAPAPNGAVD